MHGFRNFWSLEALGKQAVGGQMFLGASDIALPA